MSCARIFNHIEVLVDQITDELYRARVHIQVLRADVARLTRDLDAERIKNAQLSALCRVLHNGAGDRGDDDGDDGGDAAGPNDDEVVEEVIEEEVVEEEVVEAAEAVRTTRKRSRWSASV